MFDCIGSMTCYSKLGYKKNSSIPNITYMILGLVVYKWILGHPHARIVMP